MPYIGSSPATAPLTEDQIRVAGDNRYVSPKTTQSFTGSETDVARTNIASSRNYVGGTNATNGMTFSSTESGRFYIMNLSSGVITANLPDVSTDGFTVVVLINGLASTYGTNNITALGAKNIQYRSYRANTFALIGLGEVFRFTWIGVLGVWMAECLCQPGRTFIYRSYSGSGNWNSSPTNSNASIATTQKSGDNSNIFGTAVNYTRLPAIGTYQTYIQVYVSTLVNSSSVGGSVYMLSCIVDGLSTTSSTGFVNKYLPPYNSGALSQEYLELRWTITHNTGEFTGGIYYAQSGSIWYYPDNNVVFTELISR